MSDQEDTTLVDNDDSTTTLSPEYETTTAEYRTTMDQTNAPSMSTTTQGMGMYFIFLLSFLLHLIFH